MKKTAILLLAIAMILVTSCAKRTSSDHGSDHGGAHGAGMSEGHADHKAASPDNTKAVWQMSAEKPQAQASTMISLQIQDDSGKPVEKFDIGHEKMMHLIIVSKDLSYFDHVHPDYKGNGRFEVGTKFPAAGEYKLIADFIATGSAAASKSRWVSVDGMSAAPVSITPDKELVRSVGGVEAKLAFDSLTAGKELTLTFHLSDAASKQPITDLQPYLGAVGHVVILSDDAEQYLHVHPTEEKAQGPDAKFMTTFPKPGVYKIWGQFQRGGHTFIIPFVVNVP